MIEYKILLANGVTMNASKTYIIAEKVPSIEGQVDLTKKIRDKLANGG